MKKLFLISSFLFLAISLKAQSISGGINDLYVKKIIGNRLIYWKFAPKDTNLIPSLIQMIDTDKFEASSCFKNTASSNIPSVYVGEIAVKYIEKIVDSKFDGDRITKNGKYYALTLEDMVIIKGLYEVWWKRKKNDPNYYDSALDSSIYQWAPCP